MQVEQAGDRAEDDDARHVREDGRAELDLTRERYDRALTQAVFQALG